MWRGFLDAQNDKTGTMCSKIEEPVTLTFVPPDSDPEQGNNENTLTTGVYKNKTTEFGKSTPLLETATMTSVPPGLGGDGQSTTELDCQTVKSNDCCGCNTRLPSLGASKGCTRFGFDFPRIAAAWNWNQIYHC